MQIVNLFKKALLPSPAKGNSIGDEGFYYPTGNANIAGKLIAYSIVVVCAFIVALVYNILIALIPFPYINFFITLGVAIVMGYTAKIAAKTGKLRNYRERGSLGIFAGVIVYYFQWASFTMLALLNFEFNIDIGLYIEAILSPVAMFETIAIINEVGTWSIGEIPFTGSLLTVVWAIEGLMIVFLPFIIIRTQALTPYSEMMDKWYSLYRLDTFLGNVPFTFKKDLLEKGGDAVFELGKGLPHRHGRISVYYLPDEEFAYLSADNIFKGEDGKGDETTNIVDAFRIDKATAQALMEKYRTKKVTWIEH